jgi:hypothetical protein
LTKLTLWDEEAYSHYFAKIAARTGAGWSQEIVLEFDSTPEGGIFIGTRFK